MRAESRRCADRVSVRTRISAMNWKVPLSEQQLRAFFARAGVQHIARVTVLSHLSATNAVFAVALSQPLEASPWFTCTPTPGCTELVLRVTPRGMYAARTTRNEAALLRVAAAEARVPVPRVLLATADEENELGLGYGFVLMERAHGAQLADVWPQLAHADRVSIARQMGAWLARIRTVRRPFLGTPAPAPGGAPGGTVESGAGPFTAHAALCADLIQFNLRELAAYYPDLAATYAPRVRRALAPLLAAFTREAADTGTRTGAGVGVLTHSDFSLRNMLCAREDGEWRLTCLLDWEFGGFFPDFWEPTTFLYEVFPHGAAFAQAARPNATGELAELARALLDGFTDASGTDTAPLINVSEVGRHLASLYVVAMTLLRHRVWSPPEDTKTRVIDLAFAVSELERIEALSILRGE
eukprot:gnl/Chilomastix_cuspidata/244.p1 GENE.gnl/Chilomastix_cuspidata/244~~gnl/Chilomastix_cuspidata/244.p1  ORF type:complete len:413 (-),score=136.07 gnl/Chilomastix_cuspidata/244:1313-2551(-)